MKKLHVNNIYSDNGIRIGAAVLDKTVEEDLPILFTGEHLKGIKILLANQSKNDFYIIFRFCQFVIYLQRNKLGLFFKAYDFVGNIDKALEEYLSLKQHGWEKNDRDKIMNIVQDINDNPKDQAEMIVQDYFPM